MILKADLSLHHTTSFSVKNSGVGLSPTPLFLTIEMQILKPQE
ncbi:hypothetical protein APA_1781 [Pseudanabaena sp. lw0831]|nr:hypothetical protein APA_1781 [Pseudanabaena sp. lw0831]